MPAAWAAAGSSRAARSFRPSRLRWYAKATPTAAIAPIVATQRSVVSGTLDSASGPGPIFSQLRTMLWVIPSAANVAIPAASPERRMSGRPTTRAYRAPMPVATTSDQALPSEWSRSTGKTLGRTLCFTSDGSVSSPAAYAPTITKLV